jgi:hypothetical protein
MRSTEVVTAHWDEVWNAHEPDVLGVNVDFELASGSDSGSDCETTYHVPRSIDSKTRSACSNGADVTPSWFPKG